MLHLIIVHKYCSIIFVHVLSKWSTLTLWHAAAVRLLETMVLSVGKNNQAEVHLDNYKSGNKEDDDPPHHRRHAFFTFFLTFVVHLLELLFSHALTGLARK